MLILELPSPLISTLNFKVTFFVQSLYPGCSWFWLWF